MGLSRRKLGDYRTRIIIKKNIATADGAGGFTDSFSNLALGLTVTEIWAYVEIKGESRIDDLEQVGMLRNYRIEIRSNLGYSPTSIPKKNMLVEIVGFTTNDATIQSVIWDDWNSYWVITATERL